MLKEQLHTIPISDAMANAGECPFCYIERKTEEQQCGGNPPAACLHPCVKESEHIG